MTRFKFGQSLALIAVAGGLAACSDSGTGPSTPFVQLPVAASVVASAATGQSAQVGSAVAAAPAVLVKDANGNGLNGVTVQFSVIAGGGSVTNATAKTDGQGIASAGAWTLGQTAGANEVVATVGALPPVRFTATAMPPVITPPPVVTGAYSISTRFVSGASTRQRQAVTNAVQRWQSVITSDLSNIPMNVPAGTCFTGQPALNEVVDDILIFIEFVDIDGVGKTLGEAGPCYIRTDNSLPIIGHLKLDAADLAHMEARGTLDDVVLHEIGHVLGIGTLWPQLNLLSGSGGPDPLFTGGSAIAAYRMLGGLDAGVPVENSGEEGTKEGHWRETVFGNELMTGWISAGGNPLSRMTIASLQDIGYGANAGAASTFQLGGTVSGAVEDLHGKERVLKPIYRVDRQGRRSELPNGRRNPAGQTE